MRTTDRQEWQSDAGNYALTSLPATLGTVDTIKRFWREHCMIESRAHDVRDVTMGEDGHHTPAKLYTLWQRSEMQSCTCCGASVGSISPLH